MPTISQWIRTHIEMTLTIISGLLILIGFYFLSIHQTSISTAIFILAFALGGYHSVKSGYQELIHEHHLSVDILMLLAAIGACLIGYWLEGALLIFIFSLSESLETMAMEKSKNAIAELMNLTPDLARVYQADGTIQEIATQELKIGDRLQVRKGEAIPIDGSLLSPEALINEAAITGEPLPVNKKTGEAVIGGTINQGNSFDMTVTVENDATLFAKIIKLVEEAQSSPSKTASFIEKIEDSYVKGVLIGVPVFILLTHYAFAWSWSDAFYRGMVLLTVASPCALVASATPATLAAISRAAKKGMIFKGGDSIDTANRLQAIVFDKTGTLTQGVPEVVEAYYHDPSQKELIDQLVKTSESLSTHPIAGALLRYLTDYSPIKLDSVEDHTGQGFELVYQGQTWLIGKKSFALANEIHSTMTQADIEKAEELESQGNTVIFVSQDHQFKAFYALQDQAKPESKETIAILNQMGIHTIMLTGDNQLTAEFIARQLGIEQVRANCMPDQKASIIKELQETYPSLAMVGDGINDAPALATANLGIAMGSGTDIAMETADVVLMQDDLRQLPFAIGLSKKMTQIIKQNIIFSLSVIALLILSNIFKMINLPLGVVGHEGSTILVILNGLRLLGYSTPKLK
ncbi:heavy metal translocating P-type ATPase [Vaginisenegalia massiliensis]|uniref:heavy metal translocating P-type ATPase n=1 Tax=Vaginisenegalia massiliensis TaxID=2058294 RepID=UPI000F53E85D|nr:heavy metal translocating P-type ATPase [Vaginisenegalia massiliensis]